jgi:hypothetical protein
MGSLLEMGKEYVRTGKQDQIAAKMLEMIEPEMEKLRRGRGEDLYKYATFTAYGIKKFS